MRGRGVEDAVLLLAREGREFMRWRKRERLPAVRVARAAAISRARLSAFEQGTNWPRWDLLMRLHVAREAIEYRDDAD